MLRVKDLGVRVRGVQDSGFKVQGIGCRVEGLGLSVRGVEG